MSRSRLAVATLALSLVAIAPAEAALPKLVGTVGPGFTITLTKAGKKVTTLKPGKVTLVVTDKSTIHNFHLVGPGVKIDSGVGRTGTRTYTITLRAGTYRFRCDPHAFAMKGAFRVAA